MKIFIRRSILVLGVLSCHAGAQTFASLEGALAWQSRNDQRVPGNGGDDFSLADFDTGPFPLYRLYVGHVFGGKHELRGLYAPLQTDLRGRFGSPVRFEGSTFAPGVETKARYRFNSYRLTYAYHFDDLGSWKLAAGFTAKIRDAEVTLIQGNLRESKTNVGFVPLLNFQAWRELGSGFAFRFDLDGLAAPQGRAIDAGLFLERELSPEAFSAFAGYRTVEGGADNDEVYNFAWIHYATLGLRGVY